MAKTKFLYAKHPEMAKDKHMKHMPDKKKGKYLRTRKSMGY